MKSSGSLRKILEAGEFIVAPGCFDALSALIAQDIGFPAVAISGYAFGARSGVTEPRLTMSEMVDITFEITRSVGVPVVVDAGAGFGDPLHVVRTVRELEAAGAAACHIEDQLFPKRAHYHRNYQEQTIPADEMVGKIEHACAARSSDEFLIIARTDAMKTDGFDEGIRRANLYRAAGADMVMAFPNSLAEAQAAPDLCSAPLIYLNSSGNRVGRPVLSTGDARSMGYKMLYEAISPVLGAYIGVRRILEELHGLGAVQRFEDEGRAVRLDVERVVGLEEYYRIEEETVERFRPR